MASLSLGSSGAHETGGISSSKLARSSCFTTPDASVKGSSGRARGVAVSGLLLPRLDPNPETVHLCRSRASTSPIGTFGTLSIARKSLVVSQQGCQHDSTMSAESMTVDELRAVRALRELCSRKALTLQGGLQGAA